MSRANYFLVACLCGFWLAMAAAATNSAVQTAFNVRDFGANGDGRSLDTTAFQKALDACAAAGGGSVVVPQGLYLIGSVKIGSNTTLRLESRANLLGSADIADYPLVRIRWEGEFAQGHRALICVEKANNVSIVGSGSIFGPPLTVSRLRDPRGPSLIEISEATNVVLEGFSTQYQQLWSIHTLFCHGLTARNLTIRTINFNGDGIDVDSCDEVLIEHCDINTGDDAISLKSGRGMSAAQIARPTQNVTIRDCTLASSIFAGFSIGSEMSGGIRNVHLENCTISGHQNGIYIKSRDGRGGFIEDVTGENLVVENSPTFLGIDLIKKGIQASDPVTGDVEKWASARNIVFRNVKVNNVAKLVAAGNIPKEKPLDGLTLAGITGNCRQGMTLANMVNAKIADVQVTGYQGPLLSLEKVTGSGLNAEK